MNWLSIVLLGAIGLASYRAYVNGFVRELVSLSATILAIPIAGVFYDDLFNKVHPMISNEDVAYLVSFLSILAGVVILGQVLAHLLKRTVALLNLGAADRLAGGAFGFLKVAIICQVVLIALVRFPAPDLASAIDESTVATTLLDTAPAVLSVLPGTFEATVNAFLDGVDAASHVPAALGTPPRTTPAP